MTFLDEQIPLIIVEGFLGGAGSYFWGDFARYLNGGTGHARPCHFASVGPVSSLHDRACELFYAIMGGTVDYGEEHSRAHNHARYGRVNQAGIYPSWSRERPLHFLGHSLGGPTIVKLQKLLDEGHFGNRGHPDMILSINAVSSPFRGTQLVYLLGERTDAAPAVHPWSVGALLAKGVHILAYLSPLLPISSVLHAEHRGLTYRDLSVWEFFQQLRRSDWAESTDATPYDVTFEAVNDREDNLEGIPYPRTYYFSTSAVMTRRNHSEQVIPKPFLHQLSSLPLYLAAKAIENFDFSNLHSLPMLARATRMLSRGAEASPTHPHGGATLYRELDEEYYASDGVVPLFSQWHPLPCSPHHCYHWRGPNETKKSIASQPGVWTVHEIESSSHISIAPFWFNALQQKRYWADLGERLNFVDAAHKRGPSGRERRSINLYNTT